MKINASLLATGSVPDVAGIVHGNVKEDVQVVPIHACKCAEIIVLAIVEIIVQGSVQMLVLDALMLVLDVAQVVLAIVEMDVVWGAQVDALGVAVVVVVIALTVIKKLWK